MMINYGFQDRWGLANVLQEDKWDPWVKNILDQFSGNPELINNSPETAPSKRLAVISYRKTTHEPDIRKKWVWMILG